MPHTSHQRSKQRTKRAEIAGEDGWTRIATTNTSQREPRPLPAQVALQKQNVSETHQRSSGIEPSPLPAGTTIEQLRKHYKRLEVRWLESHTHTELEQCLRKIIDEDVLRNMDKCFVFGTGSFCGQVQGWIERFDISMYQLVAFVSIVDTIESITGRRPPAYAQEPVYNRLDVELLSSLQITTITDPIGIRTITPYSFVYLPYTELNVQLRALAANPIIALISGKLDHFWRDENGEACTSMVGLYVRDEMLDGESLQQMTQEKQRSQTSTKEPRDEIVEGLRICEEFKRGKAIRSLSMLNANSDAFHDMYLFYSEAKDQGEDSFVPYEAKEP